MSTQPVALYAQKVPPGGILIPATANPSAMFRVTMAAIDPDALPETEETGKPPRATLKIVRPPPGLDLEDDEDWEDDDDEEDEEDEDEDEEDSDDEERNGGPSDPAKSKKARQAAALKEMEDAMDEDEDEDESGDDEINLQAAISKLIKGKAKATSEDGSEVSEDLEMDEVVICTLDPEKHYQQPVDFVVAEDDRIFFKVTGTHAIYLTGNYVMPTDGLGERDSDDDEEDEDYDLSPDEDELELMDEDDESDELDDLENPRVTEIASDEEDVPKKVKAADAKGKGKNKRAAADSDEEAGDLDTMMANSMKPANGAVDGEAKLSKKQQKKLKKNNGEAAEVQTKTTEAPNGTKTDKKVQFAKNLEQGPTPSPSQKDAGKQAGTTGVLGVKEVQGVTVDDKVLGKGPAAKKGNNVSMRYIGKLQNGQVFDANKKGKPFSFKLGSGEVIKGWDIGIAGMAVGGERRVTIPPHLAYGKKAIPGIPANSKLIFDVKLLAIK